MYDRYHKWHYSQTNHCNDNCNDFSDYNDIIAPLDKRIMFHYKWHYYSLEPNSPPFYPSFNPFSALPPQAVILITRQLPEEIASIFVIAIPFIIRRSPKYYKKSSVTGPLGSFHLLDYIFNRQFKHFHPSFILISLEIQSKFSLKYSPVDFSNRGNETVWGSLLIWSKFGSQVTILKEVWLIEENFFSHFFSMKISQATLFAEIIVLKIFVVW